MEYEIKAKVWGKDHTIHVYQKSKSVWIATGTYMGQSIEVKGSSKGSATTLWIETARYRGN